MDEEHKLHLQRLWVDMINSITDIDGIVDGLFSAEILTRPLKDRINERTGTERLRELLAILPKRGNKAFYAFYDVLVKCKEYDAAKLLCPEKAVELSRLIDQGQEGADTTGNPSVVLEEEIPGDWKIDPFRIEVKPVTDVGMKEKFSSTSSSDGPVYPMKNATKGYCLIVNNHGVDCGQSTCIGSNIAAAWDKDVMTMDILFKKLGFKVVVKKNQNLTEAVAKLVRDLTKDDADKVECDSFVCIVLAHGAGTNVHCSSGTVKSVNSMLAQVARCSLLADKPKIFIVQTCASVVPPVKELPNEMEKLTLTDGRNSPDVDEVTDLLILSSNLPDLLLSGDCTQGTLFIQSLAFTISSYCHKYEFKNFLPLMDKLAAVKAGKDQLNYPIFHLRNHLKKELYLFPGL